MRARVFVHHRLHLLDGGDGLRIQFLGRCGGMRIHQLHRLPFGVQKHQRHHHAIGLCAAMHPIQKLYGGRVFALFGLVFRHHGNPVVAQWLDALGENFNRMLARIGHSVIVKPDGVFVLRV